MDRRIAAWSGTAILFAALYGGVPPRGSRNRSRGRPQPTSPRGSARRSSAALCRRCRTHLVFRPLCQGSWHSESRDASRTACHGRPVRLDSESDRRVALPRRPRRGPHRRLVRGRRDYLPPRDSRRSRCSSRRTGSYIAFWRSISHLSRLRAALDPPDSEASELNGDVHAGVRARGWRSQVLEVDDLDRRAFARNPEPVPRAFAHDRHDIPAGLRELPQAAGHARVPFVDEDALRGREFPGELADEPLFILVEPLELGLDSFPPGEESADHRNQETQSLAAGHLAPYAPQDHRRVLVDQGDVAADVLGGARGLNEL